LGSKTKEFQYLETHLNRIRAFTGIRDSISIIKSSGIVGEAEVAATPPTPAPAPTLPPLLLFGEAMN